MTVLGTPSSYPGHTLHNTRVRRRDHPKQRRCAVRQHLRVFAQPHKSAPSQPRRRSETQEETRTWSKRLPRWPTKVSSLSREISRGESEAKRTVRVRTALQANEE